MSPESHGLSLPHVPLELVTDRCVCCVEEESRRTGEV